MHDRSPQSPDLLIAGASARAAAFSAVRAGLKVATADLFADRDLAAVADVTVIESWPEGIESWAARFPCSIPLMYVGGLENHPELIGRLAQKRPLAGIVNESLHIVRTPERLHQLLPSEGIPTARLAAETPKSDGRWLRKPRKSGGGRGIRFCDEPLGPAASDEYVQEFVEGVSCSAAFLATDADAVELIGTCDSLVATNPAMHAGLPFGYFGSVTNQSRNSDALERLGRALSAAGLRGLFGVDFVRTHDQHYVVVEVNPRYTASMELFELQTGRSLVAEHLVAFGLIPRRQAAPLAAEGIGPVAGKRVVYASEDLTAGGLKLPSIADILSGDYHVADVPAAGTPIPASSPICTVLARAATSGECRAELSRREAQVLKSCDSV